MPATGQIIGAAVAFVWLGMVLAISFLETPLKFRAPGITVPLGLGIGRLVSPRPEHPRGRSDHRQNGRVTAGRANSEAETGPTEPVRPPIQPPRTPTASPPRSSATRCARSQKLARAADCSSVMNPPPTWPRCGETART